MAEDDYSEEKLIQFIKQLKEKELELKKREEKLEEAEKASEAYKAENRIKTLEDELNKRTAELDDKNVIIENIRVAVGHKDIAIFTAQLNAREAALDSREAGLIKKEALLTGDYNKLRENEFANKKSKTGNPRLDDLLYGGIPMGSNTLVMGPPFIGKETLVNQFLLEGLLIGVPALVLTTDCSANDILDELKYLVPDAEKYVEKGLLRFIDAYSKPMGIAKEQEGVILIENPTDYKGIMKAFMDVMKDFETKSKYSKVAVRSISTLMAYADATSNYRFLQTLTAKNKIKKNVTMYLLDKGMHNEIEIQTLGHLMDGAVDFKTDGTKTMFKIQGICDVQSRAWIQYQYSKRGLTLGSFSLDHIKPEK